MNNEYQFPVADESLITENTPFGQSYYVAPIVTKEYKIRKIEYFISGKPAGGVLNIYYNNDNFVGNSYIGVPLNIATSFKTAIEFNTGEKYYYHNISNRYELYNGANAQYNWKTRPSETETAKNI